MAENDTRIEAADEEPASAKRSKPAWAELLLAFRWPVAFVLVVLIAYLAYRDFLITASNAADHVMSATGSAVRGLLSGNVTETFLSSIPEFDPDGSGNLEVATLTATETFSRSNEKKILWDQFSLGVTTSEIRVPVTYRYHLRLNDPWQIVIEGGVCKVLAPRVRPSLPPAIHTNRMEKRTQSDWLRFDDEDQMSDLERSVTPTLETFAADERHLGLVRENARRAVEEFVKSWLLREDQWGDGHVQAIRVTFAGEEGAEEAGRDSSLRIGQPER